MSKLEYIRDQCCLLVFVIVFGENTASAREGLLKEILYGDDLVLMN